MPGAYYHHRVLWAAGTNIGITSRVVKHRRSASASPLMKTPRPKGDFSFVVMPGLHELVAVHDGPHPERVRVFEVDGAVVPELGAEGVRLLA